MCQVMLSANLWHLWPTLKVEGSLWVNSSVTCQRTSHFPLLHVLFCHHEASATDSSRLRIPTWWSPLFFWFLHVETWALAEVYGMNFLLLEASIEGQVTNLGGSWNLWLLETVFFFTARSALFRQSQRIVVFFEIGIIVDIDSVSSWFKLELRCTWPSWLMWRKHVHTVTCITGAWCVLCVREASHKWESLA